MPLEMIVSYPLNGRSFEIVRPLTRLKAVDLCRKAPTWEQIHGLVFHADNDERATPPNKIGLCIDPEKGLYIYGHDSKYYIIRPSLA